MTKLYYATCDKFDDSRTGYYGSKRAALAAFWAENVFSAAERARARPYVREECPGCDALAYALLLATTGRPSPALGVINCRNAQAACEHVATGARCAGV